MSIEYRDSIPVILKQKVGALRWNAYDVDHFYT